MRNENIKKYPEINNWEFWQVKNGQIISYPNMIAMRVTPTNKLAVRYVDTFKRTQILYVPFEYYCSSTSPIWYPTTNKRYGFIIRTRNGDADPNALQKLLQSDACNNN